MKFVEYVKNHGLPKKVICFDTVSRYLTIHPSDYSIPVVQGMVVDHIEVNDLNGDGVTVFLRCPAGVSAL